MKYTYQKILFILFITIIIFNFKIFAAVEDDNTSTNVPSYLLEKISSNIGTPDYQWDVLPMNEKSLQAKLDNLRIKLIVDSMVESAFNYHALSSPNYRFPGLKKDPNQGRFSSKDDHAYKIRSGYRVLTLFGKKKDAAEVAAYTPAFKLSVFLGTIFGIRQDFLKERMGDFLGEFLNREDSASVLTLVFTLVLGPNRDGKEVPDGYGKFSCSIGRFGRISLEDPQYNTPLEYFRSVGVGTCGEKYIADAGRLRALLTDICRYSRPDK